jgi:hypothetical protein
MADRLDEFDEENSIYKHPLLCCWPEFWWMNETDRAIAFDARARAYGGQGYIYRPSHERER